MHTNTILVIVLLIVASDAAAQSSTTTKPPIITAGWQVGIDLLPLINKNVLPSGYLSARKVYGIDGNKAKAWRYGLGVETALREYIGVDSLTDRFRTFAPTVSFGHEWLRYKGKFALFYGFEGFGMYNYYNMIGHFVADPEAYKVIRTHDFELGLRLCAGIQFNMNRHFACRLESAFTASMFQHESSAYVQPIGVSVDENSRNGYEKDIRFNSSVKPAFQLSFIYLLNSFTDEEQD